MKLLGLLIFSLSLQAHSLSWHCYQTEKDLKEQTNLAFIMNYNVKDSKANFKLVSSTFIIDTNLFDEYLPKKFNKDKVRVTYSYPREAYGKRVLSYYSININSHLLDSGNEGGYLRFKYDYENEIPSKWSIIRHDDGSSPKRLAGGNLFCE